MIGKRTDYAHAVTRVRALETRLLDKAKIDRLAEAEDAAAVLKILGESDYGAEVSRLDSVHDYEDILRQEMVAVRELFQKISPHPQLTDLFFLKYDILNLKILIKGKRLQQQVDDILVYAGTIAPSKLAAMVAEGRYSELPPEIARAAEEADEAADPQLVDTILDKAHYSYLSSYLSQHRQEFLRELITLKVDLTNIKSFIRVRAAAVGEDPRARGELMEKVFIPGGKLDLDFFLTQIDEPLPAFGDRFARDPWGPVVAEGIASFEQEGSLTTYEKLADDYLGSYIKKAGLISFGPEPLIAYLWAKENELQLIRIIMVGKINGLSTPDIKKRLRDVYA